MNALLPAINRSVAGKLETGEFLDYRAWTREALEVTSALQTESAVREAVSKRAEITTFSEWAEAHLLLSGYCAQHMPELLPALASHGAFIAGFRGLERMEGMVNSGNFLAYDRDFRVKHPSPKDPAWIRGAGDMLEPGVQINLLKEGKKREDNGSKETKKTGSDISRQICFSWNNMASIGECPIKARGEECVRRHVCKVPGCGSANHTERGHARLKEEEARDAFRSMEERLVFDRFATPYLALPLTFLCTPYLPSNLLERAANFPAQGQLEWVIEGLDKGFDLMFRNTPLKDSVSHSRTARENADVVEDYLQEEAEAGSLAGPFLEPPIKNLHLNRINILEKPGKQGDRRNKRYRLIMDLSSPAGYSVNDGIDKEDATVSYTKFSEVIDRIVERGRGCYLFKLDLERAYRNIPVREEQGGCLAFSSKVCFTLT